MTHRLTLDQARRIAVGAQLLDRDRPTRLLDVVRRLTLLQIDPTAAIAPNADLVLWTRLGSSYRPDELRRALEIDRSLVELDALIRPMEDLPLVLAEFAEGPSYPRTREWFLANDGFRRDILARIRDEGAMASRSIPNTSQTAWASSGWTHDRTTTQLLELLTLRGELAISHRIGRERFWDLPERVYPAGLPTIAPDEAKRMRDERRLRALGIARAKGAAMPLEPVIVGAAGDEAVVEGVPGTWRVDPEALGREFEGRTALLSPFDRLSYDRKRSLELFGFEYVLEMYKPAAKRRWGYFALPVLHHDRLVGKVDALADRKAGRLVVNAVHEDVPFTSTMSAGVDRELDDLARWLGLELARSVS